VARRARTLGTSGRSRAQWTKGRIHQKGLPQGERLGLLAGHFSTGEINASFCRPIKPHSVTCGRKVMKKRFRFTVEL